ncbi:hypothetical protein [Aestuariirhabdus litorea]|uniref:Uncharacterized protein n=1 Tax=Aestuariirhabdus litorea TaxID=2528527 RepID=A0A3P3VJV6_9GAMM|nr:hypothetical protein [Aestuariirhabdus litorea]RRJ83011.1 hypothetical protein D0544_14295 [Aestuariirhabdus litorea]RWW93169.1 hypothetical protein DZC74_14270 [Endozoicomonadaceae bacterium GTF-13]
MLTDALIIWPQQPSLSLAVWMAIVIVVMYLGRHPSHQLLQTSGRSLHRSLRLCARALNLWQASLAARNRAILLADGEAHCQRAIEREFVRIKGIVTRDLSHYPNLHRQISDTVSKIEQDYNSTIEAPPSPPAWLEVVATVAAIPRNGDPAVAKILDKIHDTVSDAHEETLEAYRKKSQQSHTRLSRLQPLWRRALSDLDSVKRNIDGLEARAEAVDQQMQRYEQIRSGSEAALQRLTTSSLTQFFISALVLVIAVLGGLINFQLIAMPMSEMVGGTSYIGAMKTSDIAALVIIMVEIAMGLFLLESLRITHLFPVIGLLDDTLRRRMILITLLILTLLASVEASLAYMRDLLALDREALKQSLAGAGVVEANFRWIPSIGQMVMGFILPFALAFVAIPLESFIHSLRSVLGLAGQGLLRALAVVARLLGNLASHLCKVLIHLYDLVIMVPLSIERLLLKPPRRGPHQGAAQAESIELHEQQGAES